LGLFVSRMDPYGEITSIIVLDKSRNTSTNTPITWIVFLHFHLIIFSSMALLLDLRKCIYIFKKMHIMLISTNIKDTYVTIFATSRLYLKEESLGSISLFYSYRYNMYHILSITMLAITKMTKLVSIVILSIPSCLFFFLSCSDVSLLVTLYTDIILNTNV
jgi:hypothetical protein